MPCSHCSSTINSDAGTVPATQMRAKFLGAQRKLNTVLLPSIPPYSRSAKGTVPGLVLCMLLPMSVSQGTFSQRKALGGRETFVQLQGMTQKRPNRNPKKQR